MFSIHRKLLLALKKVRIAPLKFLIFPSPPRLPSPFCYLENPGGGAQYLFKTTFANNS